MKFKCLLEFKSMLHVLRGSSSMGQIRSLGLKGVGMPQQLLRVRPWVKSFEYVVSSSSPTGPFER